MQPLFVRGFVSGAMSLSFTSPAAFQAGPGASPVLPQGHGRHAPHASPFCGTCTTLVQRAGLGVAVGLSAHAVARRRGERSMNSALMSRGDQEESPDVKTSVDVDVSSDQSLRRRLEASAALEQPAALPFLPQPKYREFIVNVPGDAGFDPASLARDLATFRWMQEAELKHSRIAMVSVLLWPLSELDSVLAETQGLVPGDFPFGLALAVGAMAIAVPEMSKTPESPPGFYGFDPLNLKDVEMPMSCWLPKGRRWMAEAELKHGRVAMMACLIFACLELSTKVPIVRHAPFQ